MARIFCIGRNYHAHIKELNNELPDSPVVFCKPETALVSPSIKEIPFPRGGRVLHHEVELVVVLGRDGIPRDEADTLNYIGGLAIGLDLTLRDVQSKLLAKALPWEKSKGFDFSAPLGDIHPFDRSIRLDDISFSCAVNGKIRQDGHTSRMIFPVPEILMDISRFWELRQGDMIYTGTPEGIGPLQPGDAIEIKSPLLGCFSWKIGAMPESK
jgi:acylpyruvate hydrolase